ncbi:serine/threonine protein kinase [bacterium]|nr:serine/threonine protein kinase [bacterium]
MNQIDHYQIVEKIGEGGMGEVYKGIDVMLEREVAIKLLKPELTSREDVVQRFRSEAVALGRLNHGNIATVYNFGRIHDQYYMALEFVNGQTLDSVIKQKGALPWRDAVRYAIFILDGLSHAHGFNIIHRDIKPSNIIITQNNNLKILDFGIARILEKARLTRSGHLVGTLEYVSPEQIQGQDTDARADIYSSGVVLYEMLTGHLPFEKNTEYDLIKSQIEEKPKSLRSRAESVPAMLDKIVLKALEKHPGKRFTSALEFSKELNDVLYKTKEKPDSLSMVRMENRFFRFCADYPVLILLVLILSGGSGYLFWKFKFSEKGQPYLSVEIPAPPITSAGARPSANTNPSVAKVPIAFEQDSQTIEETRLLPTPTTVEPVEIADEPAIIKKVTPAKTAKAETSEADSEKKRNPAKKIKKIKKTISSNPNIDDWANDFFRN